MSARERLTGGLSSPPQPGKHVRKEPLDPRTDPRGDALPIAGDVDEPGPSLRYPRGDLRRTGPRENDQERLAVGPARVQRGPASWTEPIAEPESDVRAEDVRQGPGRRAWRDMLDQAEVGQ